MGRFLYSDIVLAVKEGGEDCTRSYVYSKISSIYASMVCYKINVEQRPEATPLQV